MTAETTTLIQFCSDHFFVQLQQRDTNQTYAQRHNGRSYNSGSNNGNGGRKLGSNIKGLDQLGSAKCAVGGG